MSLNHLIQLIEPYLSIDQLDELQLIVELVV